MSEEARPFASLSSSLLARKGGARPAMRPQAIQLGSPHHDPLEDLGWNDMGEDAPVAPVSVEASPVAAQRAEIIRNFAPVAAAPAPFIEPIGEKAVRAKSKAAFTLRLDPERHLQLRLHCALAHRSAQQIVTQALDEFLSRNQSDHALPASGGQAGNNPETGDL